MTCAPACASGHASGGTSVWAVRYYLVRGGEGTAQTLQVVSPYGRHTISNAYLQGEVTRATRGLVFVRGLLSVDGNDVAAVDGIWRVLRAA